MRTPESLGPARGLFLGLCFVLAFSPTAAAQSFCNETDPTAAAAFQSADAVFLGRAEEVLDEETEHSIGAEDAVPLRFFEQRVRFKVIESFKGVEGDTVLVGWGFEGFILSFEVGETYLVYAYRSSKKNPHAYLAADICTRSRTLAGAGADLEYLRRRTSAKPETRLTGSVARQVGDGFAARPCAGVKVTARHGNSVLTTTTDASGTYRFVGVRPGDYEVQFDVPRPPKGLPPIERVTVAEGDWIGPDYQIDTEGKIVGFLVDSIGRPLAWAEVSAVPLDEALSGDLDGSYDVITDATGRFVLPDLDAGKYVVVANAGNQPTPETPFRRVLYPDALTPKLATTVVVEDGTETRLAPFVIRNRFEYATIHGVAVDAHGAALADVRVGLVQHAVRPDADDSDDEAYEWNDWCKTDADGSFSFTVLRGFDYEIGVLDGEPNSSSLLAPVDLHVEEPDTRIRIVGTAKSKTGDN